MRAAAAPCSSGCDLDRSPDKIERALIEICFGKDSRIGRPTLESEGCLVVRVTIDDDFSSQAGVDTVC